MNIFDNFKQIKNKLFAMLAFVVHMVLFGTFCYANTNNTNKNTHLDIKSVVNQVMAAQYGENSFNSKLNCWKFNFKDSGADASQQYCMTVTQTNQITTKNGERRLYIWATGDKYSNLFFKDAGHYPSGMVGAFVVKTSADKSWKILSAKKDILSGVFGYCHCDNAKLIQIGANSYFAWVFEDKDAFQGVEVSSYRIMAPYSNSIKDLSDNIEEKTEEDEKHVYKIDFLKSNNRFYSLNINKVDLASHKIVKHVIVNFNDKNWSYSAPKDLYE